MIDFEHSTQKKKGKIKRIDLKKEKSQQYFEQNLQETFGNLRVRTNSYALRGDERIELSSLFIFLFKSNKFDRNWIWDETIQKSNIKQLSITGHQNPKVENDSIDFGGGKRTTLK